MLCSAYRYCSYRQNGLLGMLERNVRIKTAPERWQEQKNTFDVIVTFEERVFDHVLEGSLYTRPPVFLADSLQTLPPAALSPSSLSMYST